MRECKYQDTYHLVGHAFSLQKQKLTLLKCGGQIKYTSEVRNREVKSRKCQKEREMFNYISSGKVREKDGKQRCPELLCPFSRH